MPAGPWPRILEVVDELVAHLDARLAIAVQDGPDKSNRHVPDELLVIGVTDDEQPGYTSTLERQEGMGCLRYDEAFTIQCAFSVFAGSTSLAGRRQRAAQILAQIHEALAAASEQGLLLGGAVQQLQLGQSFGVVPVRDGDGAGIGVVFDIVGRLLS